MATWTVVKSDVICIIPVLANEFFSVVIFIIGLAISTIIIWIVTKLFGQKEGLGRALLTAVIGTIVYSVIYFLLGNGWLAAIIGGIVWLLALRGLYDIGWIRAFIIAVLIWIGATIIGLLLPTAPGPL